MVIIGAIVTFMFHSFFNSLARPRCYIARYTDVGNRHRESKNTKLYEIGSGTKLFITFELKVIWHGERERHNLSMLTFPSAPHHVRHPAINYWSGLGEPRKSTFFFRGKNSTNCFSQISAHASGAWRHSRPPGPNFYRGFLFWHIWMTHPLRARVNTSVNVAPN